jgi:hypothetical protein
LLPRKELLPLLLLIAGVGFYLVTSSWHLNCLPFWIDEAIAIFPARAVAEKGLPYGNFDLEYMPWQVQEGLWDPATPLYRYLLGGWFSLWGFNEITARGFSILFGALTLIILYLWIRSLLSPFWAGALVLLCALSPTYISFSREARHFTLLLFLGTLTLFTLDRALQSGRPQTFLLSAIFLVLTLLTQTMGVLYGAVYGVFLLFLFLFEKKIPPLRRREGVALLILLVAFTLHTLVYLPSLPFLHPINCTTRPFDCRPDPLYYLKVLPILLSGDSLFSLDIRQAYRIPPPIGLAPILFGIGWVFLLKRGMKMSPSFLLLWLWGTLPLLLLSTFEVKFPRYLFETSYPALMIIALFGLHALSRIVPKRTVPLLAVLMLLYPALEVPQGTGRNPLKRQWSLTFKLKDYLSSEILSTPLDTFENTRHFVNFLKKEFRKGVDRIVTTFNDPALSYYLEERVYGMITTKQTDDSLLNLLLDTTRRGGRVFLLEQGPSAPFCFVDRKAEKPILCKDRYPRFFSTCLEPGSKCIRLSYPFHPLSVPNYSGTTLLCPWVKGSSSTF